VRVAAAVPLLGGGDGRGKSGHGIDRSGEERAEADGRLAVGLGLAVLLDLGDEESDLRVHPLDSLHHSIVHLIRQLFTRMR
jgi:hypothetical protein